MKPLLPRADTGLLWLGLLFFFWLSVWMLLPIQPNDYWWYVRLGEQILSEGHIPQTDSFTFTRTGQPMVYHSWLAAVLFALARSWGGDLLTVLLRVFLLTTFYLSVWLTCRTAGTGPKLTSLILLVALLVTSNNWAVRPQLFSYPLFGILLWILWHWRHAELSARWLIVLPLAMALWVNLHGAFVLGFLLVGAAWVGWGGLKRPFEARLRPLTLALAAMFGASLLNPRGWGAWTYVIRLLTDPASQNLGAEWQAPSLGDWQNVVLLLWVLLLVGLMGRLRAKPTLTQGLWLVGFGLMAVTGLRYVIWFVAVLTPVTAQLVAPWGRRWLDRRVNVGLPALNVAFLLAFIILPLSLLPGLRSSWWSQAPPVLSPDTPVAGAEWLASRPELPGQLWSDLAAASYLIYALPERPVWIDTRFELFPQRQWDEYVVVSQADPGWDDILRRDDINLLLLNRFRQADLLQATLDSSAWCAVYRSEATVILARRSAAGCQANQ